MNRLDQLLKNKARCDVIEAPESFNFKIEDLLNNLPKKRKRKISLKFLIAVAIIGTITTFAAIAGPSIVKISSNSISFFNNHNEFKYISDKDAFEEFNVHVGATVIDQDIKLTIDNIAIDDNFINIFYTIESSTPIQKDVKIEGHNNWSAITSAPFFRYKVDGKYVVPSNNYDRDAYFESDYILKGMERFNISQNTIRDNFNLEIFTEKIFKSQGKWHIAVALDKSLIAEESVIVTPGINLNVVNNEDKYIHNITIDKVIISPFGNQIVISEKVRNNRVFNQFALKDSSGNFLDLYDTGFVKNNFGKTTNSFEFMKAQKDIDYLTFIPLSNNHDFRREFLVAEISEENIRFNQSSVGAIIIENIIIGDKGAKVDYRIDGVVPYRSSFVLMDENGERVNLGDVYVDESVNRKTGLYTIVYNYKDARPEQISKVRKIGTWTQNIELSYDQQIQIPLK